MEFIKKYISPIDAEMKKSMQKILKKGLQNGFESGVMAQFGDSITYSQALLGSWYEERNIYGKTPDGYDYSPVLEWMSGTVFFNVFNNSFTLCRSVSPA